MKRMVALWLAFALFVAGSMIQPVSALSLSVNDYVDDSIEFFSVTDVIFGDDFFTDLMDAGFLDVKEQFLEMYQEVCFVWTELLSVYDRLCQPSPFLFRFINISGSSMEPTIHHGDIVLMSGFFYEPDNGDIVVFHPQGDAANAYIKRIIATEGQTVNIENGQVYVDGICLQEDYVLAQIDKEYPGEYPKTVPEDCVFVLGDNRNNSCDSRDSLVVGMVEEDSIVGKAYYRIFPFEDCGSLYWNYNLK